eukprot:15118748-Ditylum_brightwellii.AAC.1
MPETIAHFKGKLTRWHYYVATVYIDNFSGSTYIHMQHNLTMVNKNNQTTSYCGVNTHVQNGIEENTSETSRRAHMSNCTMQNHADQRQLVLSYGPMLCAHIQMPHVFAQQKPSLQQINPKVEPAS